jgi:DNA-binding transcriptional ArsR family regulator
MMSSVSHRRMAREKDLSVVFHALGDRTRRALLRRLAKRPAMITELARPFAISLPAISRHIRVLESAGLVTRTVEGRTHRCSLNARPLEHAEAWLSCYRRFWEDNLEQLARYVESSDDHA